MVVTILVVNRIGVEGGGESEIGEARFLFCGLAISPPRFSRFCERAFPPDFFEKKKTGGNSWGALIPLPEVFVECRHVTTSIGV